AFVTEMADNDARRIDAFLVQQVELSERQFARVSSMRHDRAACSHMGARRCPEYPLSRRGDEMPLRANLPDKTWPDPAGSHTRGQLANEAFSKLSWSLLLDVRRVGGRAVPAGAHHDVHPGGLADSPQRFGIAPEITGCWVADRRAAGSAIPDQLFCRDGLI